jgi:hypothetical protein
MPEPTNPSTPYQEPENSTVDDWHGQELAREEKRAEQLLDEADGDLGEAQARFEAESDNAGPKSPS